MSGAASLSAAIGRSLGAGFTGAISGGIAGATMILLVSPLESIMSFQAAGSLPGTPQLSMLQTCSALRKEGGLRRFFKAPLMLSLTVFTEKFYFFLWCAYRAACTGAMFPLC
jgi:hypothetical protein